MLSLSVMGETRLYHIPDYKVDTIEDESVLFFESINRIIVINKTSSFIWEQLILCNKGRTTEITDEEITNRIISSLSCEMSLYNTILSDVRNFLCKLIGEGILAENKH